MTPISYIAFWKRRLCPASTAAIARGFLKRGWPACRASMSQLSPLFSTNRMLRKYVEKLYLAAAADFDGRAADHGRLAKDLHAWWQNVQTCWSKLRFGNLEVKQAGDSWAFSIQVFLGEMPPSSVRVELYAEPLHSDPTESESPSTPHTVMNQGDRIPGTADGYFYHMQVPRQPTRNAVHAEDRALPSARTHSHGSEPRLVATIKSALPLLGVRSSAFRRSAGTA